MWRCLERKHAAYLLLVFFTAAGLLVLVHLGPVQRFLFDFGVGQLRKSAGFTVAASDFRFNLVAGSAELRDLTVRSGSQPGLPPLLTVPRVTARFRTMLLGRGLAAIEDVRLEGPEIRIVRTSDGISNLPASRRPSTGLGPLPAVVRAEYALLRYEDAFAGVKVELPHWWLTLRRTGRATHELSIDARAAGALTAGSYTVPVEALHVAGVLDGADLGIRSLKAGVGFFQTELRGRIRNLPDPVLELASNSSASLPAFLEVIGAEPVSGTVRADIDVRGRPGRLSAQGWLTATGVQYRNGPAWSATLGMTYRQDASRVELMDFAAHSALGSLRGSAALSLQDEGESHIDLSTRDLSLAGAGALLGYRQVIAALVSGDARASWKGLNWADAAAAAELTLTPNASAGGPPSLPLGGTVALRGSARDVAIDLAAISGPGFRASGRLEMARATRALDGKFSGAIDDIAAFVRAVRRNFPGALPEPDAPVGGSLAWTARLSGSPGNPRLDAMVQSSSVDFGPVAGLAVAGPVAYDSGILRFPDTSISWRDQAARFSGQIDLGSNGSPAIQAAAEMNRVSLAEVLSGIGQNFPVRAFVSGRLTAKGTLARPEAEAQLCGEELVAWGEALGTLTASAHISSSGLNIDELRLLKPQKDGPGTAEGAGQLDWAHDSLRFLLNGSGLRLESTSLPGGVSVRGIVSLHASGEGSLSDPRITTGIRLSGLEVAGHTAGEVTATIESQGRNAILTAEVPEHTARLRSEVYLADPFPARVDLEAPGLDIGRLGISTGQYGLLTGSASVRLQGEGPLARPSEIAAHAVVRELDLRAQGRGARTHSPIELDWSGQTLRLSPVTLFGKEAALEISGSLPLHAEAAPGEMLLKGTASVAGLLGLLPRSEEIQATGVARVHGGVRGSFEKLEPSLQLSIDDAEVRLPGVQQPLTSLAADLLLDSRGIEARRFEGRLGGGLVSLSGQVPFSVLSGRDGGESARGTVQFERIDPGAILVQPAGLAGSVTMQADVEASRPGLESIRGTARFSELKLRAGDLEIGQVGESRIRVADGLLSVEHFELKGPNTEFRVSGSVELTGRRAINLKSWGAGEARLLSVTGTNYGLTGPVVFNLDILGTLDEPSLTGAADVKKGRFFLRTPQLGAEDLYAHAEFNGRRVTLTKLTGQLNGGQLEVSGGLSLAHNGIENLSMKATGRNIFLDYPKGLRTVSNLDLAARSDGSGFLVEGRAELLEGEHRDAINARTFQQQEAAVAEEGALPERVRLNVNVKTLAPLNVDNNIARVDAYADLRLAGTAARPALLGRLELDEGGRIYITERVFTIVRAIINFNSEKTVEPVLDLEAQTRIGEYEVIFRAAGGLKDLESSWSSDPAASQEQIMSLLLTGSVNNTDKVSSADMMSRQAFSLFGSTMMGAFNVRVRRTLGFSEFRIEPSLISADSDPTARLTVGQNLTPALRLTYSTDLTNSNDQIWIGEYDWRRRVLARYVNESEDTDRGSLLHKIRFGGGPGTGDIRTDKSRKQERIETVELSGDMVFSREVLRKQLDLKPGAKYDFLKAQDRVRELGNFYARKGYLEARIHQEREPNGQKVRLNLRIEAGPRIGFVYSGADVPERVRARVAEAWRSGFVDTQRLQTGEGLIRQHLFREKFCDAVVTGIVEDLEENTHSVTFTISPGPRYRRVETVLDGLAGQPAGYIRAALRDGRLDTEAGSKPESVRSLVVRELRNRGFLRAQVQPPRVERDPEAGAFTIVIPVQAGPPYVLGRVRLEGNKVLDEQQLLSVLNPQPGRRYFPEQRDALVASVEALYWSNGYRDVIVESSEEADSKAGTVDVVIRVQENGGSVIAGIEVEGNVKTTEDFIRRRIPLSAGSPVDGEKVSLLRRRLTNSGTYKMGDLSFQASPTVPAGNATRPVDLIVRVREPKPFSLDYGLNYDSETGTGVLADFSLRNVLGEGRLLGYRFTIDSERRDQRIYFRQPFLGRRDITTTVDLKRERQAIERLYYRESSATLQQLVEFRRRFTLSYGYRYSYVEPLQDDRLRGSVSAAMSTLSRDSRNDVFDATRGSYISQSFEFGPGLLGGSYGYYRYFGQLFKYFGLTHPARVPGEQEEQPRFVFATGARVGFLDRIGAEAGIPFISERFLGGGSSTLRGFAQNSLGPQKEGQPLGGQAVLFVNNELRLPFYRFLDAALFVDAGNVWSRPSEFSLGDLRTTAGFGLRLRNPLIMLRFDYGWKLDRRTGESRGALHFGIGQAF